jgi:hypothetical protein
VAEKREQPAVARINEIVDGIYRLSTPVDVGFDFQFNQFLIDDERPALIYTGMYGMYDDVRSAVAEIGDPGKLEYVALLHFESDECGGMDRFLEGAPNSALACSAASAQASPVYMGGILEMSNARLYRFWGDLTEALQTGRPQNEIKHTGKPVFDELYSDPDRLEQFMNAMSGISMGPFHALAEKFDFSNYETLCDVGGATGQLSITVANRHPHMRCATHDLGVVEPIAKRTIEGAGLTDRVITEAGDFFAEPLPKADVVTMGMILHDWNLEGKMHLIKAAYDALPEGGAFIAIENLIDDARCENAFGLLMSLNMLIEFGDAFDFTGADFAGWCRQVGFNEIAVLPLAGPASAAIAYK